MSHEPFRYGQRVTITYPKQLSRRGSICEIDEKRCRAKVAWYTAEGPKAKGGRVVVYHGHRVEQWFAFTRLEPIER